MSPLETLKIENNLNIFDNPFFYVELKKKNFSKFCIVSILLIKFR